MNILLASAILKEIWAIEPRTALAYGSTLSLILNEKKVVIQEQEQIQPFAVSSNGVIKGDIEEADRDSIAVIPVIGPLMKYSQFCGPVGMKTIGRWIQRVDRDDNFKAIVLNIDSPGGTVAGTEQLANIIKETNKPIVAFVDGMACSAGMWIASAADEIIASLPNDEIGSIGVMISFADMQPYWEEQGVKFHRINADQSSEKNKVIYDALEGNYEGIRKEMLNPVADTFIETIKSNRPQVTDDMLTGKVFFAKDVKGTLIDEIGNFDYAIERALALHKPTIKTIKTQ